MKIAFFNSKTGTTLIEVMIALIIIGIIIIGGGMFFFYGRVNIVREAHRRAAVLVASQRLEELKAANWGDIALGPPSPPYYITYSSGWAKQLGPLTETVPGDVLPDGTMVTEAQWVDDDYLEVTVTVQWGDDTTNSVSSTTLIGP